jgi:predicted GNAT family N-acyltransferase
VSYRFEALTRSHDREGFSCGVAELDHYLKRQARLDAERNVAAVFVQVDEAAPAQIMGFYSLSAYTVKMEEIPEAMQKKLPRYPRLPATLLGRLARDQRFPGMGSLLLIDALKRCHDSRTQIAALAVVAEAKDDRARDFYLKFGFLPLGADTRRVFIPMGTVAQLLASKP